MQHSELTQLQIDHILDHLKVARATPSIRHLNRLIAAYVERVPWESVSRILKRRHTLRTENCPRWPAEFWTDALTIGSGGTCFETNYAFFSLLQSLGYQGYMTVNDMEQTSGCHAAVVILIHRRKYLVDVSLPFDRAVPFHAYAPTRKRSPLQTAAIYPLDSHRYRVTRAHHPHRDIFTLIDVPVGTHEFEDRLTTDYGSGGYFLDKVVIVKAVGGKIWRFNSADQPYRLETIGQREKQQIFLLSEHLDQSLGNYFNMAASTISAALEVIAPARAKEKPAMESAATGGWAFPVRRRFV